MVTQANSADAMAYSAVNEKKGIGGWLLGLYVGLMILTSYRQLAGAAIAGNANKSSITFINKSGSPALVKLVGPSRHTVSVANGGSETVNVSGGSYYILVRYDTGGKYRYSKGDPFTVHESGTAYEKITITLHTVAGGNYDSRPSSPGEFERGE
jgi:hypothetical protein